MYRSPPSAPHIKRFAYIVTIRLTRIPRKINIYTANEMREFFVRQNAPINFHRGIARPTRKYMVRRDHRKLYSTVVTTSGLGALPSLNPSDDSHERSREAGRNAARGAAKCTRANVSLPVHARAPVLCPVITTSKLRGPFNERGGITPRPLYQPPSPGGRRAIYKRFHALRLAQYFRYGGDRCKMPGDFTSFLRASAPFFSRRRKSFLASPAEIANDSCCLLERLMLWESLSMATVTEPRGMRLIHLGALKSNRRRLCYYFFYILMTKLVALFFNEIPRGTGRGLVMYSLCKKILILSCVSFRSRYSERLILKERTQKV